MNVIVSGVKAVAAGGYHNILLKQDGGVWATGWNRYGQLGLVSTIGNVQAHIMVVSSGTNHTRQSFKRMVQVARRSATSTPGGE